MFTILAVAIGKPGNSKVYNSIPTANDVVRPYIRGLVDWLSNQTDPPTTTETLPKYIIGTDYKIDYRECLVGDLSSQFTSNCSLIFCMSTGVARAAAVFTRANSPSLPIVGIVSDPFSDAFDNNLCAVSATRPQLILNGFKRFKKKANLKKIYALHRDGYDPSVHAQKWLGKKNVTFVPVGDTQDIQARINDIPTGANQGLLILPADRFFGSGDDIVTWAAAKNMLTYWTTTDWPPTSPGGFGYPQATCGRYMAMLVASVFANGAIPDQPFITLDRNEIGDTWSPPPFAGKRKGGSKRKRAAKKTRR